MAPAMFPSYAMSVEGRRLKISYAKLLYVPIGTGSIETRISALLLLSLRYSASVIMDGTIAKILKRPRFFFTRYCSYPRSVWPITKNVFSGSSRASRSSICFLFSSVILILCVSRLKLPPTITIGRISAGISPICSASTCAAGSDRLPIREILRSISVNFLSPVWSYAADFLSKAKRQRARTPSSHSRILCISSSLSPSIFSSESCSSIESLP